ncbi:MAG: protoporphyrinogen oxidase [Actinomycetota bacterium]
MNLPDDPVVVIGGGIAGLAAAYQLHRDGMPCRLLEADERVGGKIRTSEFAGRLVDEAADAFLARVPHGIELARELGLADQLIAPTARKAQVWTASGLRRLPEPNVLGIPLDPQAAEALLGAEAAAAIAGDLARTEPDPVRDDDTIGTLVRRRLGDRVHEALVDPLIGAINAGDTDLLDLAASSPQILGAAQTGPSLVGAFQRQAAARRSDAPVFHSFATGMSTLVEALEHRLDDVVTTSVTVSGIDRLPDGTLRIDLADRDPIAASGIVLAVPAPVASVLVAPWSVSAQMLASIPMVSVTLLTLAFPRGTVGQSEDLSGFVVPRSDPALGITACSYATQKWEHLAGDVELLRVSVGHTGDQATPHLEDGALLDLVRNDLETALGIDTAPLDHRISRWPRAFPQYLRGHLDRLAMVEGELNPDGVFLAGMSYRGIGIPANIDAGRTAAVSAILHVLDED